MTGNSAAAHASIPVATCEEMADGHPCRPLPIGDGDTPLCFRVDDPFGLRKAIVPVFLRDGDGTLYGAGTGLLVDHWGTVLTADHVIEDMRTGKIGGRGQGGSTDFVFNPDDLHAVVQLGVGLVYGTMGLPPGALSSVKSVHSPARDRDDPLAALRGEAAVEPAADIAVMRIDVPHPKMRATVPMRLSGWRPKLGDTVLAIGFPELDCSVIDEAKARYLLSEGMYGAYGRIIDAHPSGRDRSNPTPVIEVVANWPPGMSGGPVFNEHGEVVGIVSRSYVGDATNPGVGWGACFELMPWLSQWLPSVDPLNPRQRKGWAALRRAPWTMAGFFETEAEARAEAERLGAEYEAVCGSNVIGTDDFVFGT